MCEAAQIAVAQVIAEKHHDVWFRGIRGAERIDPLSSGCLQPVHPERPVGHSYLAGDSVSK
jgi:hypothetical protein